MGSGVHFPGRVVVVDDPGRGFQVQIGGFLAIGDPDEAAQHLLVLTVDRERALALVVVDRLVPQPLVALQSVRRHREAVFPRVDDRLQLRQMPTVFLLRLELENRLA